MSKEITEEGKSLFWYRVKFVGLIGVFLSPFIAGWMALYVFDIKPESINYGTLVQPVKKIAWSDMQALDSRVYQGGFGRKWTFLLMVRGQCSEACRSNLFYMRQIRTLLGRDVDRLQNVLVSASAIDEDMRIFLKAYPDFVAIENFTDERLFAQFAIDSKDINGASVGSSPMLYLVDPDQNYMMYYPADPDEHRVLEDLRKLMKLSQIG